MEKIKNSADPAKDWILYAGVTHFPEGSAGARRMLGVSQAIAAGGRTVVVAAGGDPPGPARQLYVEGQPVYNIQYQGIGEYCSTWSLPRKMYQVFWPMGAATVQWLEKQQSRPKAVILYSQRLPLLYKIQKWCKRHSIPLICDVVEWYDGSHLPLGTFGPANVSNEIVMRFLIPKCQGIIGISRFLADYYKNKTVPVARVPPITDIKTLPCRLDRDLVEKQIHFVYAGIPGKKDLLGNALKSFYDIDPNGSIFRLHVVGPDEKTLRKLCPNYPEKVVRIHGWLEHRQTIQVVRDADFSILLRSNNRSSNAGFPTKVVESLACGTPVVCNITSDLGEYIKDSVEGIVCKDQTSESFTVALQRIAEMSLGKISEMRINARKQAERSFDFRHSVIKIRDFIKNVER